MNSQEDQPLLNGSLRLVNGKLVFCPAPGQEGVLQTIKILQQEDVGAVVGGEAGKPVQIQLDPSFNLVEEQPSSSQEPSSSTSGENTESVIELEQQEQQQSPQDEEIFDEEESSSTNQSSSNQNHHHQLILASSAAEETEQVRPSSWARKNNNSDNSDDGGGGEVVPIPPIPFAKALGRPWIRKEPVVMLERSSTLRPDVIRTGPRVKKASTDVQAPTATPRSSVSPRKYDGSNRRTVYRSGRAKLLAKARKSGRSLVPAMPGVPPPANSLAPKTAPTPPRVNTNSPMDVPKTGLAPTVKKKPPPPVRIEDVNLAMVKRRKAKMPDIVKPKQPKPNTRSATGVTPKAPVKFQHEVKRNWTVGRLPNPAKPTKQKMKKIDIKLPPDYSYSKEKNKDFLTVPFVRGDCKVVHYTISKDNEEGQLPFCKRIAEEEADKIEKRPFREVRIIRTMGGDEAEGTGLVERKTFMFIPWLEDFLKQMVLDEQADKELGLELKRTGQFGQAFGVKPQEREITEEVLNLLIERLGEDALARIEEQFRNDAPLKRSKQGVIYDTAWLYDNVRCCRVCGATFSKDNVFNHVKHHMVRNFKTPNLYYRDKGPCPRCRQMRYRPEMCKCQRLKRRLNEGVYSTVPRCPGNVWDLILEACPSLAQHPKNEVMRDYEVMNMIIGVDLNKKHKDGRFSCPICGMTFPLRMNAKVHMRRHAGTLHIPCESCGKFIEDLSFKKKEHAKVCLGRMEQEKESAMEGDSGAQGDESLSDKTVTPKLVFKDQSYARHSLINRLVHGQFLSSACTVGEYCPEKVWTIVDMRRRAEHDNRQLDRKRQMRILELMTESRLSGMWQVDDRASERGFVRQFSRWAGGPQRSAEVGGRAIARPETSMPPAKLAIKPSHLRKRRLKPRNDLKNYIFLDYKTVLKRGLLLFKEVPGQSSTDVRVGLRSVCKICQMIVRGRQKQIVHILAHCGIWVYFCTICRGRPKFLSGHLKKNHDYNAKHIVKPKEEGEEKDGNEEEEESKDMPEGTVEETEDMAENDAQEPEGREAVANLMKDTGRQEEQGPESSGAQFPTYQYHAQVQPSVALPAVQYAQPWPVHQYGMMSSYGSAFLPEYTAYAQIPYHPPPPQNYSATAIVQEHSYQPNADLVLHESVTVETDSADDTTVAQQVEVETEDQPTEETPSEGSSPGKSKKGRRRKYRKRGTIEGSGKRERVYTEDSNMVKRILICPEKVLEILQAMACGGKPDWSNMPKSPWADRQRKMIEEREQSGTKQGRPKGKNSKTRTVSIVSARKCKIGVSYRGMDD